MSGPGEPSPWARWLDEGLAGEWAAGPDPTAQFRAVPGPGPRRPVGRGVRLVEGLAGLLAAGVLLAGVALLVARFAAPHLVPGSGLAAATGPTWARIGVQLGAGIACEALYVTRRRLGGAGARSVAALAGIVVALAALWWVWW